MIKKKYQGGTNWGVGWNTCVLVPENTPFWGHFSAVSRVFLWKYMEQSDYVK